MPRGQSSLIVMQSDSIIIESAPKWVENALMKWDFEFANIDGDIRVRGDKAKLYEALQFLSIESPKNVKSLRVI